jgi:hypothetical protein
MDGEVVYLKKYLSIKAIPHYTERKLAVNAHAQAVVRQHRENADRFLSSLETNSPRFKFPTIMNGYCRGMNPVSALYENVQEILLKNNRDHEICRWVLSLFNNEKWKIELIDALKRDRIRIAKVIRDGNFSPLDKKLLQYNAEKFRHYIVVFSSLD